MRNENLVKDAEAWKVILSCLSKIQAKNIERVVINFGTWEQQISKDDDLMDCHGHVHIELTLPFVQKTTWKALQGRTDKPPSYEEENADVLETKRLLGFEMTSLRAEIIDIKDTLKTILSRLPPPALEGPEVHQV
jgi:hypothetical protein